MGYYTLHEGGVDPRRSAGEYMLTARVLDRSGSMANPNNTNQRMNAAKNAVNNLAKGSAEGVTYDSTVYEGTITVTDNGTAGQPVAYTQMTPTLDQTFAYAWDLTTQVNHAYEVSVRFSRYGLTAQAKDGVLAYYEGLYADTAALEADTGFKPNTPLREGLRQFAQWYKEFYLV